MTTITGATFVCRRCGETKPIVELSQSGTRPRPACKPCMAAFKREHRAVNVALRERERAWQRAAGRALWRLAKEYPRRFQRLVFEELQQEPTEERSA